MTKIIRLSKDYDATYKLDDNTELYIDPIWTSEYDEYEIREPIAYIIAVSTGDSLMIDDDGIMNLDGVYSIEISAFLYNEPQTLIVGDEEVLYEIEVTLLDKNKIKLEIN